MRLLLVFAFCAITLALPVTAAAQDANPISITDRGTFIVFPDRISFNAQITAPAPITEVILEYGVDKRTCGDMVARAFPTFRPDQTSLDVNWTWEMNRTGSEPPGAVIWYRWRVTDAAGNTTLSPDQRVTWLDKTYSWQQISQGDLTLHWYAGPPAFAEELLATTVQGVEQLAALTGVRPQAPIDVYIYGASQEMRDAILYEPSWAGGVAYPANNITIIGISPEYLEWGKRTIVHELTHLIVGQMTFSCGRNVPTWLDEGIAVYAEGGLDPFSEFRFNRAVATNELLSVRAISNGFSVHPDVADLSYSQSYSMVRYLIESGGTAPLLQLFDNLRAGMSVEAGIQQAYGYNLDEFERRWRAWLGAPPPAAVAAQASAEPTPIPTIAPIAAAPNAPVAPPDPAPAAPDATPAPEVAPEATDAVAAPAAAADAPATPTTPATANAPAPDVAPTTDAAPAPAPTDSLRAGLRIFIFGLILIIGVLFVFAAGLMLVGGRRS